MLCFTDNCLGHDVPSCATSASCLPCLVLADPSEYGGIRRHCISFYKDYLKGLQAFFDLLSDGIHQNEASPHMYKRLRDALAVLDDLALRWWRVLASPKGINPAKASQWRLARNRAGDPIIRWFSCDGLAVRPVSSGLIAVY